MSFFFGKGAHNEAKKLLDDGKFAKADALKDEDDPFRDASARDDIIVW
jgi:hypothetical protein